MRLLHLTGVSLSVGMLIGVVVLVNGDVAKGVRNCLQVVNCLSIWFIRDRITLLALVLVC